MDYREKFGAESFAVGTGTTRGVPPFLHRFMAAFGSPNYFSPAHMSGGPVSVGGVMSMGYVMVPDYKDTQCMVIWAHNPEGAWPGLYNAAIRDGLKNGAKLIVVDPPTHRACQKSRLLAAYSTGERMWPWPYAS